MLGLQSQLHKELAEERAVPIGPGTRCRVFRVAFLSIFCVVGISVGVFDKHEVLLEVAMEVVDSA
jgi:hypothetical protein